MNARAVLAASSLIACFGMAAAEPGLSVTFVHPELYADAAYRRPAGGELERAEVQRDIERHLERLAEGGLPRGQNLRVEILEIDLAGQFEPFRFRHGSDVRIFREVSWPRLGLRYTLTVGDQVAESREEQLTDMDYLASFNRYSTSDRLRYEKAMLDAWFSKRIAGR